MVVITIIRYPKIFIPFALAAMAIHRLPLLLKKDVTFFKLMGCGRNGSFDKNTDWQQWAVITLQPSASTYNSKDKIISDLYGSFIKKWFTIFHCETCSIFLKPVEGHGTWDGKKIFGDLCGDSPQGLIAVLTRATIRLNRLKEFWQNVPAISAQTTSAKGLLYSIGIGEVPLVKQATFSIWKSKDDMKEFAYRMKEHTDVIKKTRERDWYSEELFVRFAVIKIVGTINGINPVEGKA